MSNSIHTAWLFAAFFLLATITSANEPNNTFANRTVLSPGVLSVADDLRLAFGPDTVVGVTDIFGSVIAFDDDSSPFGDGLGSALYGVPTSSGNVNFTVSGNPDFDLFGDHTETGDYIIFVTVYDFFGDQVDSFDVEGTLSPGQPDDYSFSDFNWLNGSFDVEIDNTFNLSGDVDYFTFTGLTPGSDFTAETLNPNGSPTQIDTILGWFGDENQLIESNDQSNGNLSAISGVVPASGELTFAVTAFDDSNFTGAHSEAFDYELELQIQSTQLSEGDFNADGKVDNGDLGLLLGSWGDATVPPEWVNGFVSPVDNGELGGLLGDWGFGVSIALPEPTTASAVALLLIASGAARRRF